MITDVKTVKQGLYRMLDIIKAHVSTRCQFKEIFHNIYKKKEKRTKIMRIKKVEEIVHCNTNCTLYN